MILVMLFWSWYQQCFKMFKYDASIIESEKNIKYLYLHSLMFQIIFRAIEMIKYYFNDIDN